MPQSEMSGGRFSEYAAERRRKKSIADGKSQNSTAGKKAKKWQMDKGILIPLLLLIGIGTLMVFSANTYTSVRTDGGYMTFVKQIAFVLAGLLIMWVFSRMNYHVFNNMKLAWFLVGVSIVLLILVLYIGVGEEENGANRWLDLKVFTFQPSELAKLAGCFYMAATVSHYPEVTEKWGPYLLRCFLPFAVICALVFIEPSLSAAIAVAVPMLVILFLAIRRISFIIPFAVIGVGGIVYGLMKESWRFERLLVFFGQGTEDYQISQSLLAIGSGGVFGKGLGNGIQKYLFLDELENDFIFANIGEELGLCGCLFVIVLFVLLVYRGLMQANRSKDEFGFYYTAGMMVLIAFQALMNMGVATGVLPVTGMVLPFVSSGGTSLLIFCAMMGPILNLTRHTQIQTSIIMKVQRK